MWPGRRYRVGSFGVWLVLTAGLVAYIAWGPFYRGPLYWTGLYAWFAFWTPLFALVSLAVGLALKSRRAEARAGTASPWFALCALLMSLCALAGLWCARIAYDWQRRIAAGTAGRLGIDPPLTPGVSIVAAIVFLAFSAVCAWLAVRAQRRRAAY